MKIAFAIKSINKRSAKGGALRKGGAQRVLVELANELSERGHGVTIFCTDVNSRDDFMYPILPKVQYCNLLEEIPAGFIDRAKFKFGKNFIYLKWRFLSAIKSSRLDWNLNQILYNYVLNYPGVIKRNNPDVFILFEGFNSFLHRLSRLFTEKDFPIVYSVHNSAGIHFDCISRRTNPYALVKFSKVLELVDAVLVLLPEYIDELPRPFKNKAFSIPNPIDQVDKHKKANPELNTGMKTILAVGRLSKQKNHAVLLEAFAKLSPRNPGWQVKIFGQGELREKLTDQIRKLKLTDKVFLMGVTDAIHEEYKRAHILAMPSIFEGFPLTLGEAMAHGLPAVGFENVIGVNSLIKHGHNGLLADGKSPVDGLTSCLEQLMTNPGLRAELGQNGVESMKLYDPEKIYDLWEKTLLEVKNNFSKSAQP